MSDAKPDALLPVAEVGGLQPGYAAPSCRADGETASALFAPADYSLWLLTARLEAGATIEWHAAHGDEAVYVTSGSLTVGGHECRAGGSVIVESGVAAVARAEVPTEVVHVGPTSAEPPVDGPVGPVAPEGHTVRVITAEDFDPIPLHSTTHGYFSDGTGATARIAFFKIQGDAGWATGSHLHSEDEIVHVLSGALQAGRQTVGAGMSVAIPADRRYALRADEAFTFLNYRADVSSVTMAPGSTPFLETEAMIRNYQTSSH